MSQKPEPTTENFPPSSPFVAVLILKRDGTEQSVVRSYSCWAAAMAAIGAALTKLIPENSRPQWQPAINAHLAGGPPPGRAAWITYASTGWRLDVYPKAWWEWPTTPHVYPD